MNPHTQHNRGAHLILASLFVLVADSATRAATDEARLRAATSRIDDARLHRAAVEPDHWLSTGRDPQETHYSPLDDINPNNVSRLGLVWSHELGTTRGVEAVPIVVDGVMYFTTPWSVVHAFDVRTGKQLWTWDPQVNKAIYGRRACCDVVNRGVAVYRGKIYAGILDGRLVALDAATGQPVWQTLTVDPALNYTITGAPRIAAGKVIIGNGGAEFGVRGFVTAYDAETGKLAWRFFTVPGNPALGFESPAMEKAAKTWSGEWWTAGGGGTCWDAMAYDPELKLLYVGTGNGSPWNRRLRSPGGGDNLYLSSIIALNPDNGELVWHFQTTPGDTWDYTATQNMILADLEIGGRLRQVIMQAPKNGFFYVLDRRTGEFLSAKNYVTVNWAEGIDADGRPIEKPGVDFTRGKQAFKPNTLGSHGWQPMAYSPRTKWVYLPIQEVTENRDTETDWKYDRRWWNLGYTFVDSPTIDPAGALLAWDPVNQRAVWRSPRTLAFNGGILTTGGDLVFQGTAEAQFVAHHARTGDTLWRFPTGTAIIAAPVTYRVDGKQYVTVLAGWGGSYGLYSPPAGDALNYEQVGRVLTFALDGSAGVPAYPPKIKRTPTWPAVKLDATPEAITRGEKQFNRVCGYCHWQGGIIPDLRYTAPEIHQVFDQIVLKGLFASAKGMPAFNDLLSASDVEDIRAYILSESKKLAETKETEKK
jgi:quinohemoprotein ethanol dehydrogenase